MGGNVMSALQIPIQEGDVPALKGVLKKYGLAVPLLLHKQFTMENGCLEMDPVFTTPLKYCIQCNQPECLRVLLEAGGDPNEGGKTVERVFPDEEGKGGATLLHRACKKVSVGCVKVLLELGARVYDCDEWGVYPVHVCVGAYGDFQDSQAILDILLREGNSSDIHLKDGEYEKLPLHYAAFYGNKNMCQRLLDLGVDINAKDKHGRTAYQTCLRHKKVQEFLKSKGCEIPEPEKKPPLFLPLFAPRNTVTTKDESGSSVSTADDASSPTTTVAVVHAPTDNEQQKISTDPVVSVADSTLDFAATLATTT